jgi:hypothetical protein
MTLPEIKSRLGISRVNRISDNTVVIETSNGGCAPATPMELHMWELFQRLADK